MATVIYNLISMGLPLAIINMLRSTYVKVCWTVERKDWNDAATKESRDHNLTSPRQPTQQRYNH